MVQLPSADATADSTNTNTSSAQSANPLKRRNNQPAHQQRVRKAPPLKKSGQFWFEGPNPRFIREPDDNDHTKMFVSCSQEGCDKFTRRSVKREGDGTNNYRSHYATYHKHFTLTRADDQLEKTRAKAAAVGFFQVPQINQTKGLAFTKGENHEFRRLLVAWITQNNLPLRVVESEATIALFTHLNPGVKIVGRTTLYRDIMDEFNTAFEGKKSEIQKVVKVGHRISLTTDTWTSRNNNEYMTVTAHYSGLDMTLQSTVLDIVILPDATHDHEYLCKELVNITDRFEITSSILAVTRDNASVNDAMLRLFQEEIELRRSRIEDDLEEAKQSIFFNTTDGDIRCISHIYNLAVQAGLKGLKAHAAESRHAYEFDEANIVIPEGEFDEIARRAFFKMRSLVYAFKNKRHWRVKLQKQCKAESKKYYKLQLDMPIRWNSTHNMMKSFLKLQTPITNCLLLADDTDPVKIKLRLTNEEWEALHDIKQFFLYFVKPSVRAQADSYPTLHRTVPQLIALKRQLNGLRETTDRVPLKTACLAAFEVLDKYFREALTSRACAVATIIDPRYKLVFYQNLMEDEANAHRKRVILGKLESHFQKVYNQYETRKAAIDRAIRAIRQEEIDNPLPRLPDHPGRIHDDSDDDIEWRDPMQTFRDTRPAEVISEYNRYLRELCLPYDASPADVQDYWRRKAIDYPILSQIAADFLAIPATSAPSERVFSSGSDIMVRKRMRMCAELLRPLICLRAWGIWPEDNEDDEYGT